MAKEKVDAIVGTATLDEVRDLLDPEILEGVEKLISAGLEVYFNPPKSIRPDSTNRTSYIYFTRSLEDDSPLGVFEFDKYDFEGDGLTVAAALHPTKQDGSGMVIRGRGEAMYMPFEEAVDRALVHKPRNSFQAPAPHIRNAGARRMFWYSAEVVQIVK